jgi:hypothetical protein
MKEKYEDIATVDKSEEFGTVQKYPQYNSEENGPS